VNYNNGPNGQYDVSWSNVGNFVAGKGWKPGAARVVAYNGTWNGASVNSVSLNDSPASLCLSPLLSDPRTDFRKKGKLIY
jgi:hypothetical protein